jgi:hypothetical protein
MAIKTIRFRRHVGMGLMVRRQAGVDTQYEAILFGYVTQQG